MKKKPKSSGTNVVMILLIVFGSLAGLALLACCGIGGFGYFFIQKAVKDADLKSPADIQRVTSEITDITIPPEFMPKHGSSIFMIKSVEYEWCPNGACSPRDDGLGTMTLTVMDLGNQPGQPEPVFSESDVSDEALKLMWRDYTKAEHDYTIRGRKCRFTILQGEQIGFEDIDDGEMESESGAPQSSTDEAADKTESAPATNDQAAPAATVASIPPRKKVQISGSFPAKKGECSLTIHLAPEQYDEKKILDMLNSIR